jgi:hypothetical protein
MPAFISTAWHEDWMSLRVFHKDTITMLQGRVEIEGKAIILHMDMLLYVVHVIYSSIVYMNTERKKLAS